VLWAFLGLPRELSLKNCVAVHGPARGIHRIGRAGPVITIAATAQAARGSIEWASISRKQVKNLSAKAEKNFKHFCVL
jgi:hypothetical protein